MKLKELSQKKIIIGVVIFLALMLIGRWVYNYQRYQMIIGNENVVFINDTRTGKVKWFVGDYQNEWNHKNATIKSDSLIYTYNVDY